MAHLSTSRLFGGLILALLVLHACAPASIMTVNGPVAAKNMGTTLIHEHVFLDWTGADSIQPQQWDQEAAMRQILPFLRDMQTKNVKTMLECTPNYIGRNPILLKRLADSTGIQILTNTGYYGAVRDKYVPAHAYLETADQLADRWVQEYQKGIEQTNIRPGFIKIAVDGDAVLSAIDEKIVRAAARTHLRTGLTIVSHTGPDLPALQQVAVLESEGVSLKAWVWTHAQGGTDSMRVTLARKGAWISLDGLGWVAPVQHKGDSTPLYNYIHAIEHLKSAGLLHRVLISHDAGWYTHKEPYARYEGYTYIFKGVLPLLRQRGMTEQEIEQLLVKNPRQAYTIRVRKKR